MNVALIAHDNKKAEMIDFVTEYYDILKEYSLFTTGTTGKRIMECTDLEVTRMLSGPYGGDQQIGNLIAIGKMDMVIFFRDPLTAQPHEPDISALMRLCDVHQVPLASCKSAAILYMKALGTKE
ncbi:methylglyoxal synthase [Tannockella kyphosi]|uniref:methylglyoxal synthase n=1 Tax=Tannockella kyphosi TaxID=2899121 RepID=UPI0020130486|nr:methylglyoxal synthase [Tannockella kyphosi]